MYAKDWLTSADITLMPPEAEGLFIRLLNLSWDNNGLPRDEEAVKVLAGNKFFSCWKTAWYPVRAKFVVRNGKLINPRQEKERSKQRTNAKKRRQAALERWGKNANAFTELGSRVPPLQSLASTSSISVSTAVLKDNYTPEFEAAWAKYPKREGGNPKKKAFKAWNTRLREGVSAVDLDGGVVRYAHWCRQKGKENTEVVMMAATFFGPDERWKETWWADKTAVAAKPRATKFVEHRDGLRTTLIEVPMSDPRPEAA